MNRLVKFGGVAFVLMVFMVMLLAVYSRLHVSLPPTSPVATAVSPTFPTPIISRPAWQSWATPLPVRGIVVQDGLLWAATGGGVMVWDLSTAASTQFRVEHGLPSHQLTSITADARGHIWVGSADAGVAEYDGRTWHTTTTADGLPSNSIETLAITPHGHLLAGTAAGLSQYDPPSGRWVNAGRTSWQLAAPAIHAIWPTGQGWWLATNAGVAEYDGRTWHTTTTADGLPSNDVLALAPTAEGMWAATANGLALFDGQTWHPIPSLTQPIYNITALPTGELWLGTQSGVVRLPYATAAPQAIPLAADQLLQTVDAVAWDVAGTVWVGSATGVYGYTTAAGTWRKLPLPFAPSPATNLWAAQGQVWQTTAEGVYAFTSGWQAIPTLAGQPTSSLTAVGEDNVGGLLALFNTPSAGIAYRPRGGTWQMRHCQTGAGGHIYGSTVGAVRWTVGGTGWLVAHDGLLRLDSAVATGWDCHFLTADGYSGLPSHTAVQGEVLYLVQRGELWRATADGMAPLRPWGAETPYWQALVQGGDGALWLASAAELAHYDGQQWTRSALEWPLPPTAIINDAAVGQGGELWLATDVGLAWFANGRWQWLTTADGLPSNDIRHLLLTPTQELWLLTAGGTAVRH